MRKILFIVIPVFSIGMTFASQKIFMFHINGVNTRQEDAYKNAEALNSIIGVQSNIIANNGRVDLLYNKVEESAFCGLCNQLIDVLRQKAQEHQKIDIDDFVVAYLKTNGLDYKIGTPDYEIVKAGIKDDYLKDKSFVGNNLDDITNQFNVKIASVKFKYLMKYMTSMESDITKPLVLLLPHSQGNLYANQITKYLIKAEQFPLNHVNVVGIASPSSQPLDGYYYQYITASNDYVINGLNVLSWLDPVSDHPATANSTNTNCTDIVCHSLIGSYLNNENVKNIITSFINISLTQFYRTWLLDGFDTGQLRFAFRIDKDYGSESQILNMGIYKDEDIIYNGKIVDEKSVGFLYFIQNPLYAYSMYPSLLVASSDKYLTGKYQVISLNNKSLMANLTIFAKNGEITKYTPSCTEPPLVCYSNAFSWKFLNTTEISSAGINLNIYKDIEDHDRSIQMPEVYKNGKIIFGEFLL